MAVAEGGSLDDGGSSSSSKSETRGDPWDKCLHIMISYGKEFCFVLAVVFTVYATTQNSPLKTQKLSIPKRFFPWNSFVTDYYLGTVEQAFERVAESDLTFVMYYASWDAISMETRWKFEKTARHFHNEIQFLAINCWWPEGQCRRHFRRIHSYPVLMAYVGGGQGIQFRGPYTIPHIFRFLENLLHPLHAVFTLDDLISLRAKFDTVVVAYFDFKSSPQPAGFQAYYNAALKALEKDSNLAVCFAVLSNERMAASLGLNQSKSILLLRFNDSINFSTKPKTESLVTWTFKQRNATAQWLSPPSSKSLLLSNFLEKPNPALILFTPKNPFMDTNPYFSLLNEVAMDYFNCNKSTLVRALIDKSSSLRTRDQIDFDQRLRFCQKTPPQPIPNRDIENRSHPPSCCYSVPNQDNTCEVCFIRGTSRCHELQRLTATIELTYRYLCEERVINYDDHISTCCVSDELRSGTSGDDRVAELLEEVDENRCRRTRLAVEYGWVNFPLMRVPEKEDEFSGLGCRTNRTMVFVAIDSVEYEAILSKLGLNGSKFYHETAVVIHHSKQEVQHLLQDIVTKKSLVEFITNFTHNQLGRYLRSTEPSSTACRHSGSVCLTELTADTFSTVVLDSTKDVFIVYYASWCGFCSAVFHIILEVADYFKDSSKIVFARINGDRNDLPWEFTVEKYPTFLFFPAGRKTDSSVFPDDVEVSVPNLIRFVLANVGCHTRLSVAIRKCRTGLCVAKNRKRLLSHIQRLVGELRVVSVRTHHVEKILVSGSRLKRSTLEFYLRQLKQSFHRKWVEYEHSKALQLTLMKMDATRMVFPVDGILQKHKEFERYRTPNVRDFPKLVSSIGTRAA